MNILYVSNRDPRLKNSGSEQRTNLLWESLKRYGKVYTFQLNGNVKESEMIDGEHPIYRCHLAINRLSYWRLYNAFINRLTLLNVWNRKVVKHPNMVDVFKGVKFDLVISRYIYPLCYYKYWEIAPLLIDIDDHPYQVFETIFKNRIPFGLKTIGKWLTKLQTDYIINKSVGGWIANEEQIKLCRKNYIFLPNIPQIPSKEYSIDYSFRNNIFTVGDMGYGPNIEGVSRFLEQIWPLFHKKYPDVQYSIVGKGAPDDYVKLWNSYEGVKYLGFVEDLEQLYEKSLATVVPVYSGGGTCIKTLEAMAYSRTCLSTQFGARGLSEEIIKNEKGVLLFNNAGSFINIYKKIQDVVSRQKIEEQGRTVIFNQYSVESFNKAVDNVIMRVKSV